MTGRKSLRVHDSELDYDPDLIYTYKGSLFTGVGYDEDPRSGLSEISYVEGRQEGPSRDWYPSGRLGGETEYKSNARHGFHREFREDGTLVLEELYEHGVRLSSRSFDEGGLLVESYRISEDSEIYRRLQRYRRLAGD